MFKSKVRERRIFTNRRRLRRRFSWVGAIASVLLFILVLELLTRIFIDVSGNRSQFTQTEVGSEIAQAYQLNFVAQPSNSTEEKQVGLMAKSSISVGYELVGHQKSEYWQFNEYRESHQYWKSHEYW